MIAVSQTPPAGITWDYDRVELIADGIVHAMGLSSGWLERWRSSSLRPIRRTPPTWRPS